MAWPQKMGVDQSSVVAAATNLCISLVFAVVKVKVLRAKVLAVLASRFWDASLPATRILRALMCVKGFSFSQNPAIMERSLGLVATNTTELNRLTAPAENAAKST